MERPLLTLSSSHHYYYCRQASTHTQAHNRVQGTTHAGKLVIDNNSRLRTCLDGHVMAMAKLHQIAMQIGR